MTVPELSKGSTVHLIPGAGQSARNDGFYELRETGTNGYGKFDPAVAYEVTRVTTNYLWVRVPRLHASSYYSPGTETTIQLDRETRFANTPGFESLTRYRPSDENYVPPRPLGQKPEGDEFIGIDHPGIQWLWDDMGAFASRKRHCAEYDQLADELGIPGRVREFTVSTKVGTLTVSAKLKARSKAEAETQLQAQLANQLNDETKENAS